jgi:hypothetical protein
VATIADDFISTDADRAGGEIRPRFVVRRAGSPDIVFADGWMSDVGLAVGRLLFKDATTVGHPPELRGPLEIAAAGAHGDFERQSAEARLSAADGLLYLHFSDNSAVPLRSEAHGFDPRDFNRSGNVPLLRPGMTFVGERGTPYVTGDELGRGGTAAVFAIRSSSGAFAAKCLSPGRYPLENLVDRFGREVANLRAVKHPNILTYLDCAYSDTRQVLVTELADMTLADKLRRGRPPTHLAEDWMEALLQGLAKIHAHAMVHRDLSPKNVLFVNETLKIGDFGVAKADDDIDITDDQARVQLGSLIYISSEQRMAPQSATPSDDVFSAGQLAYYLLTGIVPIGNPPPVASCVSVGGSLGEVVERMRAYSREDRYDEGSLALAAVREARASTV